MIDRLINLELENFRAYGRKPQPLDLDADVVLIYGRNGSGKTSLLSAVEYGVTGHVGHLRPFRTDYPDVLSHVGGTPGRVRLVTRVQDGTAHTIERRVGETEPISGTALSRRARETFLDRSYLSQAHLARLLHLYQETGSRNESTDPPIIRFIRDLLDLDALEALENGLDIPGHVSRLRKNITAYRSLETRVATASQDLRSSNAELEKRQSELRDAQARYREAGSALGLDLPESTSAARKPLADALAKSESESRQVLRWAEALGQADDPAPPPPPPDDGSNDYSDLAAEAERELAAVQRRLDNSSARPAPFDGGQSLDEATATLRARLERTRATHEAQVADTAREREAGAKAAEALEALRQRAGEIERELAALADLSVSLPGELGSLRDALQSALAHISGELCPVCDRDYAEVGGGLRPHVLDRLERLGARVETLQTQLEIRDLLLKERGEIETATVQAAASGQPDRLRGLADRANALALAAPHLDAAEKAVSALEAMRDRQAAAVRARQAVEAWRRRVADRAAAVQAASRHLDADLDTETPERALAADTVSTVRELARERLAALDERVSSLRELSSLLDRTEQAATALRSANSQQQEAVRLSQEAEEAKARVDALVKRARSVRAAASEATKDLIRDTFDDRLSALVDDIYTRLVRDERFVPRLTPQGSGPQLTAAIHAYADGEKVADNVAALLSSANLNTAAISLFVALHLTASAQPRTLLFDDPVQSMDDVHATNLAALFRTLAYHPTDPRQIVIATHDKALFDYLALELGPTKSDNRLLLHTVSREGRDTVTISSEERTWESDEVHFGLAS